MDTGFTKVTQATIVGRIADAQATKMLEPSDKFMDNCGVLVEPVVEPDGDLTIPIAITNHGRTSRGGGRRLEPWNL